MSGFDVCAALERRNGPPRTSSSSRPRRLGLQRLVAMSCTCGFVPKGELSGDLVAALLRERADRRLTFALGSGSSPSRSAVAVAVVGRREQHDVIRRRMELALLAGVTFVVSGHRPTRRPDNRTGVFLAAVAYLVVSRRANPSATTWVGGRREHPRRPRFRRVRGTAPDVPDRPLRVALRAGHPPDRRGRHVHRITFVPARGPDAVPRLPASVPRTRST